MTKFSDMKDYDLLTEVEMVKTDFGGRKVPVFDDYRGQFFWHINGVNGSDWDARYYFENGELCAGDKSKCKIRLMEHLKEWPNANFSEGAQFAIREGARIVAIGRILEVRF